MFKLFENLISFCEIHPTDIKKKQEYRSLSALVTTLFAVIFGVGLSQLDNLGGIYDLGVLVLGYTAVTLSWWGYNWGIMIQPEVNKLNYLADVLLIVLYWLLINKRGPLHLVVLFYFLMFGLYYLWEVFRNYSRRNLLPNKELVGKAMKLNLRFFYATGAFLIFYWLLTYKYHLFDPSAGAFKWSVLSLLFLLIIGYRIWSYRIYHPKKKELVEQAPDVEKIVSKARSVAMNAKAHLSEFKVGAAIVSDTGNIYGGCNIEFDNYSNTIHAEEAAISAFVTAGEKKAVAIAVCTFGDELSFPCGMCRQSLFELGGNEMKVVACNQHTYEVKTMGELLPVGFKL